LQFFWVKQAPPVGTLILNEEVKALKIDGMNRIDRMENHAANRKLISPFGGIAP